MTSLQSFNIDLGLWECEMLRRANLPEILSLLASAHDLLACQSLLKLGRRCSSFTKYVVVILSFYTCQSLAYKIFLQVVDGARNLSISATRQDRACPTGKRTDIPSPISGMIYDRCVHENSHVRAQRVRVPEYFALTVD